MPGSVAPIADTILRRLSVLMIATVALYLVVSGIAYTNTHALCTLRTDLENRVSETQNYLKKHPKGFPGVPAEALKASLENSERSVNSLSLVPCI